MAEPVTNAASRLSRAYAAHRDDLLRYAVRRTGVDDAADVVSAVFAIAWRKIDQMPPDPLPWLYRIAGFEVLKAGRRRAHAGRLAADLAARKPVTTAEDQSQVIDALWVEQVIGSLRPADAELLRLVVWEDLDVPSAAAVLGCSVGAAHVRLHRARKRVEERLRALAADDLRRESEIP